MPQFGIYRNPGRNPGVPFLCQIQSTRLETGRDRVVIALVRRSASAPLNHALTPHLTVQGVDVYADPMDVATVPARLLAKAVEVLGEAEQNKVAGAMDEMLSRA